MLRSTADGYLRPRRRMVERIAADGVRDRRVLDALASVERHRLIPEVLRGQAYREAALPIEAGQTISAPGIVATMSEALQLTGDETVLEVGTGSGYQAAVLARLAHRIVSIERIPRLAARARSALDHLGVDNVVVHLGDGSVGRPSDAPFDAILVTAGGPQVPETLLEQLAPDGRLVGPFGPRGSQRLLRLTRRPDGRIERKDLGPCRFVDLIGANGFAA